jgi:hypothetical protein
MSTIAEDPATQQSCGTTLADGFLVHEYDSIAQAHFNTVDSISAFFRHYLLVISLPSPLLALAGTLWASSRLSDAPILGPLDGTVVVASGLAAFGVSAVGLCVMGYVCNLRFDAVLYARTLNGIRAHFVGRVPDSELRELIVLPMSTTFPSYAEWTHFAWVVGAFAIIDTGYVGFGCWLLSQSGGWLGHLHCAGPLFCAAFFATHFLVYSRLAGHREKGYYPTAPSS